MVLTVLSASSTAAITDGVWSSNILVGGSEIAVRVDQSGLQLSRDELLNWVRESACAVATYYGRFPVSKLQLELTTVNSGSHSIHGTTFSYDGALIRITMSASTTETDLRKDWVLTHEMVHLAFPSVADEHHWIEEGIATYVEPIARVEVGNLDAATVWRELVKGLPQGLPQPGDQGLDYTHTWGRTYWGGALFCLLADVELHRATANKYGLRDALRAIVSAGGTIETSWPLARALKLGDQAVGVPVLAQLYEQMKATPIAPNLPDLWKQLGLISQGDGVIFNNHAPLAMVRVAIVSASPAKSPCASAG
jgi:hypothetical protein